MKKSEEMLRLERDMNENPELLERLKAEFRRIAEAGEAECDGEAMMKAAAALGYEISLGEQDRAAARFEAVDDDELDNVAGGDEHEGEWCMKDYYCLPNWNVQKQDEEGHNGWCITLWHCYITTLHTETESELVTCFKDYNCEMVYH